MNVDDLTVGLLYEGILDEKPLETLVKKILKSEKIRILFYEAGGSIDGDLKPAAVYFFEGAAGVCADLVIYISDTDENTERSKRIVQWAKDYINLHTDRRIVLGFPDPSFEQWLISEETAIKTILGLSAEDSLPHRGDKYPKKRLEKMLEDNPSEDYTLSTADRYLEITRAINLDVLGKRDQSFKKFRDNLESEVKSLCPNFLS